jgi:hypothetical protein
MRAGGRFKYRAGKLRKRFPSWREVGDSRGVGLISVSDAASGDGRGVYTPGVICIN